MVIIMIIHVVQRGETTKSIAESYGISEERMILENELSIPPKLAIGETLVILFPEITHKVKEEDTLYSIATTYDVTVEQLLRNNPYLSDRDFIFPGEEIVIQYREDKIMPITTNGYAYPFIDINTLKKTLPFLSYLSIYSYKVTGEGEIINIEDREIIRIAKEYRVAPIMLLTGFEGTLEEEIRVTNIVLNDEALQDRFIEQVINIMKDKGYYGVNVNTPYVAPSDRALYIKFFTKFADNIAKAGFRVFNTLSLSPFEIVTKVIYEGLGYRTLGEIVDGTTLISYEWGFSLGIPYGIAPYETIGDLIFEISNYIPASKISIGISSIGYIWQLPFDPEVTRGLAIPYRAAVELAYTHGAHILYDEITKSAYFQYIAGGEYMVRFRDARSIDAFMRLIPSFGLNGNGIWNIMFFFPQMWSVINSQYDITKLL